MVSAQYHFPQRKADTKQQTVRMLPFFLVDAPGVKITDQLMTLMNIEFFGEGIDSVDIKFNE